MPWYLWYLCKIHIALVSCWIGQAAALGAPASCAAPRSEFWVFGASFLANGPKKPQTSKMKQQHNKHGSKNSIWRKWPWCRMMSGLRRWCNDIRSYGLPGIAALPGLQLTMQVALVAFPLSFEGWSMVLKPVERLNSEHTCTKKHFHFCLFFSCFLWNCKSILPIHLDVGFRLIL